MLRCRFANSIQCIRWFPEKKHVADVLSVVVRITQIAAKTRQRNRRPQPIRPSFIPSSVPSFLPFIPSFLPIPSFLHFCFVICIISCRVVADVPFALAFLGVCWLFLNFQRFHLPGFLCITQVSNVAKITSNFTSCVRDF